MGLLQSQSSSFPVPLDQLDISQKILESTEAQPAPLPVPSPTQSFWMTENDLAKHGSDDALDSDADIVIIGSGITGVGTAYHLATMLAEKEKAGTTQKKIVILEARDFCSGATGRNGGHLTATAFRHFSEYPVDEAIRALALERHTVSSILTLLQDEDVARSVDLVQGGHVDLYISQQEYLNTRKDYEAAKAAGLNLSHVKWLSTEEMEKTYGTNYPGTHISGTHNLWPLKLVTHLYHLATAVSESISVKLHTHTPATSISRSSLPVESSFTRRWIVSTPRGSIHTSHIMHASNAYASHLLPHLAAEIKPVRGQVLTTRERGFRNGKERMEGWGGNEGFEYWFPRPRKKEGEEPLIVLGGGREASGGKFEIGVADDSIINSNTGEALRAFLPAVFAASKDKVHWEVEQEWTGIMGYTISGLPLVGPVRGPEALKESRFDPTFEGQWISAGYTGHGMPRAFGCAEAISSMIVHAMFKEESDWQAPEWLPEACLTWNGVAKPDSLRA